MAARLELAREVALHRGPDPGHDVIALRRRERLEAQHVAGNAQPDELRSDEIRTQLRPVGAEAVEQRGEQSLLDEPAQHLGGLRLGAGRAQEGEDGMAATALVPDLEKE